MGKTLFKKTSRVDKQTDREIVCEDLKEYVSGGLTFAISQVEAIDLAKFSERKAGLVEIMEEMCSRRGYVVMALMVTDIFEQGTDMILAGQKKKIVEDAFGHDHVYGGIYLKGVMSRKKQVVPVIYEALRKEGIV